MIKMFQIHNYTLPVFIKDNHAKTTILMIHGFASSYRFIHDIDKLPNNFNIISLSLPGTIDVETDNEVTADLIVAVTEKIISQIKHSKLIIFGHSFGGYVASIVAQKHRIKRVFLLNPIHPYIVQRRSWKLLKTLVEPLTKTHNVVVDLFKRGKKLLPKAQFDRIERFLDQKSSWFGVVKKTIINKERICNELHSRYQVIAPKTTFIVSRDDDVVGTQNLEQYLTEKLRVNFIKMGIGHSPIPQFYRQFNDYLNQQIKFEHRPLARLRKII